MLFTAVCEVRGHASKTSKKGNTYELIALEQGVETINMITTIPVADLKDLKGENVLGQFEYNVSYKQFSLIGFELAE